MLKPPPKDDEALLDEAAERLAEIIVAQWEYQHGGAEAPIESDQPPLFLPIDL